MTWEQKYKQNERLIYNYMAFMQSKSLSIAQALKLMTEIGRLNMQNKWINQMTVEDYYQQCIGGQITIPSKL